MTNLDKRAADKVAQLTVAVKSQRAKVRYNLEGPQEGRLFRSIADDEGLALVALETELHLYTAAQQESWYEALGWACRIVSGTANLTQFGGEAGRQAAKKWIADNGGRIAATVSGDSLRALVLDMFSNLT